MSFEDTIVGREVGELEGTVWWREQKAVEYPDDKRNVDAAELLSRLAKELRLLDGTHVAADFERRHDEVFDTDGTDTDHGIAVISACSEYRRAIGFLEFPSTAEDYLDRLTEIAREAA